jgi:hypothetical protein
MKLAKKVPVALAATVGATAAFVPGESEAHCGHGMYGRITTNYFPNGTFQSSSDTGCTGKGTPGWWGDRCLAWDQSWGNCIMEFTYYNCYSPC